MRLGEDSRCLLTDPLELEPDGLHPRGSPAAAGLQPIRKLGKEPIDLGTALSARGRRKFVPASPLVRVLGHWPSFCRKNPPPRGYRETNREPSGTGVDCHGLLTRIV